MRRYCSTPIVSHSPVAIPAFAVNFTTLETPEVDNDDIVIEVVNDWTLPEKAIDLDIMETAARPVVTCIDNGDDVIYVSGRTVRLLSR